MEEFQCCLQIFWRIFKYHSKVDICYMSGYMYHVYVSVYVMCAEARHIGYLWSYELPEVGARNEIS